MGKPVRYYWDANCWLGLLNRDANKAQALEVLWAESVAGKFEILTSVMSLVEVFRLASEQMATRPLLEENDRKIENIFAQPNVIRAEVDVPIATWSRRLRREHDIKGKVDCVHIATALWHGADEMHTWDSGLLAFNGKLLCKNGKCLVIKEPKVDGPLFDRPP